MARLVVRHEPEGESRYRFAVERVRPDGVKTAPPVEIDDPLARMLGTTNLLLGDELRWYLENYLDYPFGPNQLRAERVTEELHAWGSEAFETLLGAGQARDYYRDATRNGHTELHLVIASDDARVLAWPWEALHDPLVGDLAHHCRIERQLDDVGDPPELHPDLSRDRIGILLVTARPYERDVAYRSISRPLVELIHSKGLPATVKLLRPPTFEQLRDELRANPGAYHIVHFDGHGGFGHGGAATDRFKGPQGRLMFEQEDGSEDPITGSQLSELLREHRIPIAVLNACQSAMLGGEAEDAFASVATSLLRAGVRSVVAMGYSLYVSAARELLPAFYRRLFESGSVAEATRAGRQALLARPERRPGFELEDWLVPVLYQQQPLELTFVAAASGEATTAAGDIPPEARLDTGETPYGLIGRDSAVLALERASRRAPAGLLVHGLGGVGKTTLARGYIEWLAQTQGLPKRVIWQSFAEVRSFDYVRNRLVEELFGTNAMALPDEQKWPALLQALRENPTLIIWDNFESASGTADAGGDGGEDGGMPAAERGELKEFLERLRGGKTRVVITSRSDEAWLGTEACWRVALGGLHGEEREALARAILSDQGIKLDPHDQTAVDLIDSLEGHPLMMRAILPRLGMLDAAALRKEFEQYVPQAGSLDPLERKLYATLRYVEEGLPAEMRPLLIPIGLHEGYVDADYIALMAGSTGQPFLSQDTRRVLELLQAAGLVQGMAIESLFRLHPALTRYLRTREDAAGCNENVQAWQRGFVEVMARLAHEVAPRPLHEQRSFFAFFEANIELARTLAEGGVFGDYGRLTQSLGHYALNQRSLALAQRYYEVLARHCERHGGDSQAAAAYHQLGVVAGERRDFGAAEVWYRKAIEIFERLGDERAEGTYHQLGIVATERRDFAAAEVWYRKALEICERLGDASSAATTYHQLGVVACERRDFDAAEVWHRKGLEIIKGIGDDLGVAQTYQELGRIAYWRQDFDAAETWFLKALEIKERLGDDHSAAITYHSLGGVALQRTEFDAAEAWYRKSLQIKERLGDEYGAEMTYHELGTVALRQHDFNTAEAWYRKALEICDSLGDAHGAALTHGQLGNAALEQRDFDTAESWYRKALEVFDRLGDNHFAAIAREQLDLVASGRQGAE